MKIKSVVQGIVLSLANHVVNRIPSNSIRCIIYRLFYRMKIGKGAHLAMGIKVFSPWRIQIGEKSVINSDCLLDGRSGLIIGSNVDISWEVIILTLGHDHNDPGYSHKMGPVNIGDRVCLTTRTMILPGVTIGEGAVVAAGAVVTRDVEPFSVVAGVPARPIKIRSKIQTYSLKGGRLFH
jgi:maltose O-acetyltransferase